MGNIWNKTPKKDSWDDQFSRYTVQPKNVEAMEIRLPEYIPQSLNESLDEETGGIDWVTVAQHIQNYNYEILEKNFIENSEYFVVNLLLLCYRFVPDFKSEKTFIGKFEEKRKRELDRELSNIRQHVIISDSFLHALNKYVGFVNDDKNRVESLSSIKYNIIIEDILAKPIEALTNLKRFSSHIKDEESLAVCVNLGSEQNLGFCNLISPNNLSERSFSVATLQSEKSIEELDLQVEENKDPLTLDVTECFRQLRPSLLDHEYEHLKALHGEWIMSPRKFRNEYKGKCIASSLLSHQNKTEFSEKFGVIYGITDKKSINILESFVPTITVPYGLREELRPWHSKNRRRFESQVTGDSYVWPPKDQRDDAASVEFHLIPFPRKKMSHVEWQMDFTELADSLFKTLTQNQFRVYLFSILLFKSNQSNLKLLEEVHFKYILFDLVEKNPAGPMWFDENLGQTVLMVFKVLRSRLKKKRFPHYFIPEWNVFDRLASAQQNALFDSVHSITEFYLSHVLHAVSHLKYLKSDYYPLIDIDEVCQIVYGKNVESFSEEEKKNPPKVSFKFKNDDQKVAMSKCFISQLMEMISKSSQKKDSGALISYATCLKNILKILRKLSLDRKYPKFNEVNDRVTRILNSNFTSHAYDYWFSNLSYKNNLTPSLRKETVVRFQT